MSGIAERSKSEALTTLLSALAQPGAALFTLGCDLGCHEEPAAEGEIAHVAGGYVQVVSAKYAHGTSDDYMAASHFIQRCLEDKSSGHDWELQFVHTFVDIGLDGPSQLVSSVFIWFYAKGDSVDCAASSREMMLVALAGAVCRSEIGEFFNGEKDDG